MRRFFDPDSPLMQRLTDLADLVILNLLWLLCSLPVVTAGAASAALYRCTLNMVRRRGSWGGRSFFAAFRENFVQGTGIWLILLAALAVLGADAWLLYGDVLPGRLLFGALLVLGVVLWLFETAYVFAVTAQFENTLKGTMGNALVFAFSRPLRSLLMGLLNLLPLILFLLSPNAFGRVAICWILFGFSLTAYVNTLLLKPVFAPYMPAEEPEETE